MPLLPLAPGVHYLPGAVNSVIIANGQGGALLIDTGLDESHARKLLRSLTELNLRPRAILNTHSHADHHGGNAFILGKFPGLPIYAPPLEATIINYPLLEPLSLYGACPPRELQTKFLLAQPSPAQTMTAGTQTIGGVEVELIEIPGHAVQMYAVRFGDLLYAADGLFGPEALHKHPLTFCADSGQQKASAARLGELSGIRTVLPGHGEPSQHLKQLAQDNLAAYERITATVLKALSAGEGTTDELLARVCDDLQINMTTVGAALLNRAVISAHLAELLASGQVKLQVADNRITFRAQM